MPMPMPSGAVLALSLDERLRARALPGNVVLSVSLVTVNKIIMKSYGFNFV